MSFFPTVKKTKTVVAVIAALLKLITQITHMRNITFITILLVYLLNGDGIEKRGMRRAQTGLSYRPKLSTPLSTFKQLKSRIRMAALMLSTEE